MSQNPSRQPRKNFLTVVIGKERTWVDFGRDRGKRKDARDGRRTVMNLRIGRSALSGNGGGQRKARRKTEVSLLVSKEKQQHNGGGVKIDKKGGRRRFYSKEKQSDTRSPLRIRIRKVRESN